jgi:hypothetical protein
MMSDIAAIRRMRLLRLPRESGGPASSQLGKPSSAQERHWIPAFAGKSMMSDIAAIRRIRLFRLPRESGGPASSQLGKPSSAQERPWIPAFAEVGVCSATPPYNIAARYVLITDSPP